MLSNAFAARRSTLLACSLHVDSVEDGERRGTLARSEHRDGDLKRRLAIRQDYVSFMTQADTLSILQSFKDVDTSLQTKGESRVGLSE